MERLLTPESIAQMAHDLEELMSAFNNISGKEKYDQVGLKEDEIKAWTEGTKQYASTSMDDLWTILGLPPLSTYFPAFNSHIDPSHEFTHWDNTKAAKAFFKTTGKNGPERVFVRWYQLVGVVRILHQIFKGQNTLLMDQVGLGKTLQAFGVIAMLNYFREYYAKHKDFPGAFGECSFFKVYGWLSGDRSSASWTSCVGPIAFAAIALITNGPCEDETSEEHPASWTQSVG